MSDSARVTSIDALRDWKEAVCVFKDDAAEALCANELEIRRFFDWLDQQTKYWQNEVRRREDLVVQARNALVRKKMMVTPAGREPDTIEEEKALRRAKAMLAAAEEKLETARKIVPVVRRAVEEYEAPARRLSGMLDSDVPQALALLGQKLDALDAYLSTAPPPAPAPPPSTETSRS
jgi:hypothetical protein